MTADDTCIVPTIANATVRCEGGHPSFVPDLGFCEITCDEGFILSDVEMANMTCEVGEGGFEAMPTCDRKYSFRICTNCVNCTLAKHIICESD